MQIKIEIDVKPEELRRFLGLPDVAGLQEDIIHFLRDKMGADQRDLRPRELRQREPADPAQQRAVEEDPVGGEGGGEDRGGGAAPAPKKARPRRRKPADD